MNVYTFTFSLFFVYGDVDFSLKHFEGVGGNIKETCLVKNNFTRQVRYKRMFFLSDDFYCSTMFYFSQRSSSFKVIEIGS